MDAEERIQQIIDEIVEQHPDGIKGPDLVEEVIAQVGEDEVDDLITLPGRTVLRDEWIASKVRGQTRRRRNVLRRALETLRDAVARDTLLAELDPVLKLAFPTSDGESTMRTLRYWAIADLESIRNTSHANRIDVDIADDELAQLVNGHIANMRRANAINLGGLFK